MMEFSFQQKAVAFFIAGLIILGFGMAAFRHYEKEVKQAATFNSSSKISSLPLENKSYIVVSIRGEIKKEGIYKITQGTSLVELIKLAKGLTPYADIGQINLLIPLKDQQEILIPRIVSGRLNQSIAVQKININVANLEQLSLLPGISETLAQRIIKYREKFGSFLSLKDLEKVKGLTPKKISRLEAHLCFSY